MSATLRQGRRFVALTLERFSLFLNGFDGITVEPVINNLWRNASTLSGLRPSIRWV